MKYFFLQLAYGSQITQVNCEFVVNSEACYTSVFISKLGNSRE